MEHIKLTDNISQAAKKAAAVLRRGGVILYPTETLYGLGADARSDAAVAKLYAIKGRDKKKPIHALVSGSTMAERYGILDANVRALIRRVQGPLSLVVPKKKGTQGGIFGVADTFGFRISHHAFCEGLLKAFGGPITTTSANRAGKLPERSAAGILEQLGEGAAHIDLVVDAGELPPSAPSTLVDLSHGEPVILREGAVSADEIWNALRAE